MSALKKMKGGKAASMDDTVAEMFANFICIKIFNRRRGLVLYQMIGR